MTKIITSSTHETELLGQKIAKKLLGNGVIALYGPMGMGKTAFVRGLAFGFNINEGVCSPTFAIVHEYSGDKTLYHFDMYRVTSWEDLYSTGFFDYIDTGILVIEWSENIEAAIPENAIRIHFSPGETPEQRIITIEGIKDI